MSARYTWVKLTVHKKREMVFSYIHGYKPWVTLREYRVGDDIWSEYKDSEVSTLIDQVLNLLIPLAFITFDAMVIQHMPVNRAEDDGYEVAKKKNRHVLNGCAV